MFLIGLEDAMVASVPTLAHHMDLYTQEVFNDFSLGFIFDKVIEPLLDPEWVPRTDIELLPCCILTNFPIGLRNLAMAYQHVLH